MSADITLSAVDGVSLYIHGTIPVAIFAADLDVRLIQTPTLANGPEPALTLAFAEDFLQHRQQLDDPAMNG
jgi:hypothetical protein